MRSVKKKGNKKCSVYTKIQMSECLKLDLLVNPQCFRGNSDHDFINVLF